MESKNLNTYTNNTNDSQKTTNCPYTNFINKFSFLTGGKKVNDKQEGLENATSIRTTDTEKGVDSNALSSIQANNNSKCPFNNVEATKKSECPYKPGQETKENPKNIQKQDEDDEEEVNNAGGCPVMNKHKKEPPNKHFEAAYEIPRFGQFDFMFLMRGGIDEDEFLEKTKTIRQLPRHMKYTLFFQNQEKLAKVHQAEFPRVFFIYDDVKEKGNRMYRRKKYREAIENYTYSYGLLKWIEFKDKKRQEDFLKKPSLDPILDSDITEKQVYLDDVAVEEDSFKACVVYLLMDMSYAYMELRHYYEAIECLDECEKIAEEKVSDVFFRRSQARTYNKNSSEEDLAKALADIDKAIAGNKKEENLKIYNEHREILFEIMKKKTMSKVEATKVLITKAKRSYDRIKINKLNPDDVVFTKSKDAMTQYKIMKE
jgi:hypothetical protein